MNKVIVHINKEITPFFNYDESDYEEEFLDVRILINGKDLEMVTKEIDKAFSLNKLPILVGGTGLYMKSLLFPYSFNDTIKDEKLREYYKNNK